MNKKLIALFIALFGASLVSNIDAFCGRCRRGCMQKKHAMKNQNAILYILTDSTTVLDVYGFVLKIQRQKCPSNFNHLEKKCSLLS